MMSKLRGVSIDNIEISASLLEGEEEREYLEKVRELRYKNKHPNFTHRNVTLKLRNLHSRISKKVLVKTLNAFTTEDVRIHNVDYHPQTNIAYVHTLHENSAKKVNNTVLPFAK